MKNRKPNNQGSTLLTVVIILAFIGILGSMMLSVTMTNLQMKMLERKAKENFYTCEIILDEIRTGLHELTLEETRDIYENEILKNFSDYVTKTEYDINVKLKDMVSQALIRKLGNAVGFSDSDLQGGALVDPKDNDIFDTYSPDPLDSNISRELLIGKMKIESETVVIAGENKYQVRIVVRDIDVKLTKNDFESRICTDIVVELPEFSFEDGTQTTVYRMEHPYREYALVTDGEIISDHKFGEGSSGLNTINGSVYAGEGITIGSQMDGYHSMNIFGNNIVTRGDITVKNTGSLNIEGAALPAMVWANNLITDTDSTNTIFPTGIAIDGICLIKDDLTLDGFKSQVTLDGAYVGYTGNRSSLGSSIIVNGNESSLDLSGLDSLILAGRAHISVDDNDGSDSVTDIMTGESVAIKSNQKAYLIPGRFITNIEHNPITNEDISTHGVPGVSFTNLDPIYDINYPAYVDTSHPFKIASRQTVEMQASTILSYYYLAFQNGKLADLYLSEYDESLLNNTSPFTIDSIRLPDLTDPAKEVKVVGNMTSYDAISSTIDIYEGLSGGYTSDADVNELISSSTLVHAVYQGSSIHNYMVDSLDASYSKISHLLSLESSRVYKDEEVVESTVIPSGVDEFLVLGNPEVEYKGSSEVFDEAKTEGKIIIVNGNATINNDITGMMIVYGDVTITDGVKISGLIVAIDKNPAEEAITGTSRITVGNDVTIDGKLVAMGNIILGSNNQINSSESRTEDLFANQSEVLKNIFRNLDQSILYTTNPSDKLVDLSSMIYYRNWRRE